MGFRTKKQLHDAIVQLDEHERAIAGDEQRGGFWLGVFVTLGLAFWGWTGYEIYAWVKSL